MKVAILTMFNGLSTTYSLVNVVADHLRMILDANINVKLLVSEDCPEKERFGVYKDERIQWVKVTNKINNRQIKWYDYSQPSGTLHSSFYEEVDLIVKDFVEQLKDVDVCIMHDILYQGWHLVHNIAIRKTQEILKNIRFIEFTHSLPVNRPKKLTYPFSERYTSMPRTTFVYPTYSGISALSKQYNIPEGSCRVVYNALPTIENMSEHIQKINEKIDLITPDIIVIYPARLTTGKRLEKVVALAGAIKTHTEKDIKVIFCDFPSLDIESDDYKNNIRFEGNIYGLEDKDILFTSDIGYKNGFPREAVLELFTLSNLFICPSYSESFGLTVLEAASRGNFLVLNEAVPALEEIGKKLNSYFMRWDAKNFGFDSNENYDPSEKFYYTEHGKIIVNLMREDRVLNAKTQIRQRYSLKWIWENQLKLLIEN